MADIREVRFGEKCTVGFDFSSELGLGAGEQISSANATVSTGLNMSGNAVISANNTQVSAMISCNNNTAGNYYGVTLEATTNAGNILKRLFIIRVITDTLPTPAGVYALVTLSEVKGYIGKTTDEDDAILERIIDNVSREFNAYTDRILVAFSHTNVYLDGNGKQIMWLPNYPVISTGANTAIYEDGILLSEGEDYDYILYPETGKLYRVSGVWYWGPRKIKATYVAGYICTAANNTLPEDIRMAALKQIAYEFGHYQKKDWGVDSITYPDGSRTQTQQGLLKDVQVALDFYRRFTL
jgi:hypothetical protein